MSFIHSKLCNSLSAASVENLVFIKSNMSAFHDMQTAKYYPSDEKMTPTKVINKTKNLVGLEGKKHKPISIVSQLIGF